MSEFLINYGFSILAGVIAFLIVTIIKLEKKVTTLQKRCENYIMDLAHAIDKHQVDVNGAYANFCDRLEEGFESIETMLEHAEYDVELEVDEDLIEDDIHLISREEYHLSNIGHDHCTLKYYPNSDRLEYRADLDPEPFVVGNVEELIGDGLKYFGVRSCDDDVVYIRNNKFKVDFKIERVV